MIVRTLMVMWVLDSCGAFGLVGSVGPCTFLIEQDCRTRADQVRAEQGLSFAPLCKPEHIEVWFQ